MSKESNWSLSSPAVSLRNTVWHLWEVWNRAVPIDRGKYRLAAILRSVVGLPVRRVAGVQIEWFPPASADVWLATKMHDGTPVHAAMDRFMHSGDVFVDIGANIGLFSILAAAKYGAEPWAFEPSVRELNRLRRNAALNNVLVRTFPFALGEKDADGFLLLENLGNHMMNTVACDKPINDSNGGTSAVACPVRRFDALLSPDELSRVRLVKIDVEGFEMNVLRGMEGALQHMQRAAFVIEVTPAWLERNGSSASDLYGFMTRNGWRAGGAIHDEWQWDETFTGPACS
jgi:FkbM family methyltransferase